MDQEARWPAIIAVVAIAGLYFALHDDLVVGPRWLYPVAVVALLIPTVITHRMGKHHLNKVFGFLISGLLTAGMIASTARLIAGLPSHRQAPSELLQSATALWLTNIFVFALWYWRLDAGGPHGRDAAPGHDEGAFLFPQMTMPPEMKKVAGQEMWSPTFVDYLFLAFNTSTAFSPTDTPALTPWAKVLMMIQSLISLTVLALLAAGLSTSSSGGCRVVGAADGEGNPHHDAPLQACRRIVSRPPSCCSRLPSPGGTADLP